MAEPLVSAPGPGILSITYAGLIWHHVPRPTDAELRWLGERYGILPAHLGDALTRRSSSRLEPGPGYLMLMLRLPTSGDRTGQGVDIWVFLGASWIATVQRGEARALGQLQRECEAEDATRQTALGGGPGSFLVQLVSRLVDSVFPIVESVDSRLDAIEGSLVGPVRGTGRMLRNRLELVREIAALRRQSAEIAGMAGSALDLAEELEAACGRSPLLGRALEPRVASIVSRLKRLGELARAVHESGTALQVEQAALVTTRTADRLRLLTIVVAMFLPAAALAAVLALQLPGMPLAGNQEGFNIALAITAATSLLSVYAMRSRY